MDNLTLAKILIERVNEKFKAGSANLKNGLFDGGLPNRRQQLNAARAQMQAETGNKIVEGIMVWDPDGQVVHREVTGPTMRVKAAGPWLESHDELTVGNCGERCFYALHLLNSGKIPNANPGIGTILSGNSSTSINHDFIVLGATNIAHFASYDQNVPPATWQGSDIVICDPWHQASTFSFEFGVAYPLNQWAQFMPSIIAATIKGMPQERTLNRSSFELQKMGV